MAIVELPKFWAIRHKPSGRLIPALTSRAKSFTSREPKDKGPPRLFCSEAAAKVALQYYVRGQFVMIDKNGEIITPEVKFKEGDAWEFGDADAEYRMKFKLSDPTYRKFEDYEIVEFNLVEILERKER